MKKKKRIKILGNVERGIFEQPDLSKSRKVEKYIKGVERIVRSSMEYKEYIKFLKDNMDMNRCAILNHIVADTNNKISVEVHHEPFTLYYIVETILRKFQKLEYDIDDLMIGEEVSRLHYDNLVGLVPLSKTVHEIVHSGDRIKIPLFLVYGNYSSFIKEYGEYMSDAAEDMFKYKVEQLKQLNGEFNLDFLEPLYVLNQVDNEDDIAIIKDMVVENDVIEAA